jgi:hypothetical protein
MQHHAPAPLCIFDEQCQKTLTRKKILRPVQAFSVNQIFDALRFYLPSISFDGAINGIKSLINWKKTASAKSNSLQTQKTRLFIDGIKRQNH